jgi:CO dehydrogenase maturation factor
MTGTRPAPLRVVVSGKGGVGKTTLTALVGRQLARSGRRVLVVDADEQMNLARTLGLPPAACRAVVPLSRQEGYIEETVGARPGESGGMLRLNPDTSDAVARFGVDGPDGVRLLVMGGLRAAGGGCLCPEHSLLGSVVAGVRREHADVVLMDTHAGVEHFGRALARGFDRALVVTDPSANGVAVAVETARLARDLGIPHVALVVNRARSAADAERVARLVDDEGGFPFESVTVLPWDDAVLEADPSVGALVDSVGGLSAATGSLVHQWVAPRMELAT